MRRYKTKTELVNELGRDWYKELPGIVTRTDGFTWSKYMDIVFGMPEELHVNFRKPSCLLVECINATDEAHTRKLYAQYQADITKRIIVVQEETSSRIYVFRPSNGYVNSFSIDYNPTDNCQLSSIKSFANILHYPSTDIVKILTHFKKHFYKRLFIFDVDSMYTSRINYLNPIVSQHYDSTNGSKMILGIIQI